MVDESSQNDKDFEDTEPKQYCDPSELEPKSSNKVKHDLDQSYDGLIDFELDDSNPTYATFGLPEVLSYCLSADLNTLLYCSSNVAEVLGCSFSQIQSNGSLLLRHVHPDDRFRVLNTLEEALLANGPASVAYRWTSPASGEHSLLFNHCAAAHSDQGEVVSGVIVKLDESLSKEISLISGFGLSTPDPIDQSNRALYTLLDESLCPLSTLPPTAEDDNTEIAKEFRRLLSQPRSGSLINELQRRIEMQLVETGKERFAHERIFCGPYVFRATLKKVTKDTFTPYFHFSLEEISEEFMEKEELRSLRRSQSGLSILRDSLIPLSKKLREIERTLHTQLSLDRDELSHLTHQATTLLNDIQSAMGSQNTKPYINGRQLVMQTLSELSSQLPSRVKMQVEMPSEELWIWRSIASKIEHQLSQVSSWLIAWAPHVTSLEVALNGSAESKAFSLELTIQVEGDPGESIKDICIRSHAKSLPHESPQDVVKSVVTSKKLTSENGKSIGALHRIQILSSGCFNAPLG